MRSIGDGSRQFEERSELRGCLELGNWVELLERARERVGETPRRLRSEFIDLWIEVQVVDAAGEMLGDIQLALNKGPVDDQLRVSAGRRVPFQASTCFLIGSKFRCMRSTPTARMSTRLKCLVCFASTGVKSP